MPIYEYRCGQCGHELEAMQKISDEPLRQCPACGQEALSKLLSAPGFRLKGGGWYETDFKKDKKRNLHKDDSNSSSAESKASGEKSDKKADGKADAAAKPAGKPTAAA
jgi:putative FmdB family regulatory protein